MIALKPKITKAVSDAAIRCIRDLQKVGMSGQEGLDILVNLHEHIFCDTQVIVDSAFKMAFWGAVKPVMDMVIADEISELKICDSTLRNSSGWIKIFRSIIDNKLWTLDEFSRGQSWIDLILIASYIKSYQEKMIGRRSVRIYLERGQLCVGLGELAERWKWSRTKVLRFLERLEREGMIVQQFLKESDVTSTVTPTVTPTVTSAVTDTKCVIRLISIVNYDKYQGDVTPSALASVTSSVSPAVTPHNIGYNKKNIKEKEKEKKENKKENSLSAIRTPVRPRESRRESDDFSFFRGMPGADSKERGTAAERKLPKSEKESKPQSSKGASKEVNPDMLMKTFNEYAKKLGSKIPPIRKMTPRRIQAANRLLAEYGNDTLFDGILLALRNDFLNGGGPNGWVASFDWILDPSNFLQILEGQYTDGRKSNKPKYD